MKSIGIPLQFACFVCRKSFKRPQFSASNNRFMTSEQATGQQQESARFDNSRQYKCPDCGGQAHFMGIDFKAPKKSDIKAWQAAEEYIRSGKLYNRQLI
jgi:hypothetical protein